MSSRRRRAPTPAPPSQPLEPLAELTIHLGLCMLADLRPRHQNDIVRRGGRLRQPAKGLAQTPSRPVPLDRPSHTASHREAQSMTRSPARQSDQGEHRSPQTSPLPEHALELPPLPQPAIPTETLTHDPDDPHTGSGPQSLPTLLPTPLQNQPAPSRPHPHQEAVCALPLPLVGLERPLHADSLLSADSRDRDRIRTNSRGYRKDWSPVKDPTTRLLEARGSLC
jgi:hypothetical protein